tara:strand:- start:451 stop:714 length:264 start_codon:yes stop_codon:yes gene_type:complete
MILKPFKAWKYALGSFNDDTTHEYDNIVCLIRTVILLTYLITNTFIVAGVIKHYNNNGQSCNQRAFKEAQTNQERFEETRYATKKER